MTRLIAGVVFLLIAFCGIAVGVRDIVGDVLRLPSEASRFFRPGKFNDDNSDDDSSGTRWAILLAGSNGYWNYRHQADVCHAYQLLRKGGLKEENIIVFMYDDIADSPENPRPGVIINNPQGEDVYEGVPKDYTGQDVTVGNFFAAILGNKTALTGGSGKVVDSGPNDHIFIYYTDHGGPGVLGMPTNPYLYADDLIDVLKKKHASGTYKSLVFYLEACESVEMATDPEREADSSLSSTAKRRLSCTTCFDALWFCYSPVHQMQQYYRLGLFDNCSQKWSDLVDCLTLKTKRSSQVQEILEAREKAKPHLWKLRTPEEASVHWRQLFGHLDDEVE